MQKILVENYLQELFGKKEAEVNQLKLKGSICISKEIQDKDLIKGYGWQSLAFFRTGPVLQDPFFVYAADLTKKLQDAKKGDSFVVWLSDYGSDKTRTIQDHKRQDSVCASYTLSGSKKVLKRSLMHTKYNISFQFETSLLPGKWLFEYSDKDTGTIKRIS